MTSGMLPDGELFDPAFVSPVVVYLSSEECETSGDHPGWWQGDLPGRLPRLTWHLV